MTDQELQEITERSDAVAVDGAWKSMSFAKVTMGDGSAAFVATSTITGPQKELIVHANQDIPKLLAEIERLKKSVVSQMAYHNQWEENNAESF